MSNLVTILLKLPRNTEVTPESAQTFLAALSQINSVTLMQKLTKNQPRPLALEICLYNQQIRFQITCAEEIASFIETQIQSNYPLVMIEHTMDPLQGQKLYVSSLELRKGNYYPINTSAAFKDVDPLSSVLSVLSKSDPDQVTIVQYALESTSGKWQALGQSYADNGVKKPDGTYGPRPDAAIIKEKIIYPGFLVSIRVASNKKEVIREIASAYGVYARADANSFKTMKKPLLFPDPAEIDIFTRVISRAQILNIVELATIWHLPSGKIKTASIIWGHTVLSEPPDNLPVSTGITEEQKLDINFFGRVLYKNRDTIYGIKTIDRKRHIWLVGKTGTGKSTLIANMAIDDLKKGRGLGIIDPHGDLCDTILDYIPSDRINDTIVFNPADKEYPIVINPLEVNNKEEAELVVSGIVSIFNKIFGFSWGPRLEYILRNTLLSLAAVPNTTLEDVLIALTNPIYRKRLIDHLQDPVLKNFWVNEFNKMPDKQREEAISPILNKVGQFVTSPLIRRIIGKPKSSMQVDQIMNEGKILLANLSQGRMGEDNSALLGAMLITKFQLAAMRRVDVPEAERRDFFLYVDEFQNFATPSFMKILSEARKYKLALMLANQYMAQIPEEVEKSILGNAGTIISYTVGADDAAILQKEFGEVFAANDLVNLVNHQVAIKLMVDGHSTRPFLSHTLPLPANKSNNKEKVLMVSRERWSHKENDEIFNPLKVDLPTPEEADRQRQQEQQQRGGQGYRPREENRHPYVPKETMAYSAMPPVNTPRENRPFTPSQGQNQSQGQGRFPRPFQRHPFRPSTPPPPHDVPQVTPVSPILPPRDEHSQ